MITSTRNPHIVQARKLTQRKHRRQQNRFLVEGLQLLAMALEVMPFSNRIEPVEIFYSERLFTGKTAPRLLDELTAAGGVPIEVSPDVLNTLSERDKSQGLAVTFTLDRLEWEYDELLDFLAPPRRRTSTPLTRLTLVLDKLQDPSNVGTIIRTADAVGAAAVIMLEPCADPFDPKTVRGTMGSLFTVPFTRVREPDKVLSQLPKLGYRLVGADASLGETAYTGNTLADSVALFLGNEARGLSPELRRRLDAYVSLPLRGHAESLNVSVAGGVLMYEWLRQSQVLKNQPDKRVVS